jgi:hypothetical protein
METERRPINDSEALLLLYYEDWLRDASAVGKRIIPGVAAGHAIKLWGSAEEALAARATLTDSYSCSVNAARWEAARDGVPPHRYTGRGGIEAHAVEPHGGKGT